MSEVVAAFAVPFFLFGMPVLAFIITRVLAHRERLEMIRHGFIPPPGGGRRAYRQWQREQGSAFAGSSWQAQQPPPTPGPAWPGPTWAGYDDEPQRALFKGIRTAFIGLALLIGLSFIGGTPLSRDFHGGPWLLGGLIPMFVGIAQMIIALLSGAQLPGVGPQPRTGFAPPPPGPPGPGPAGPDFRSAPPPWQPQQPGRSPFEEFGKPPTPPDRR